MFNFKKYQYVLLLAMSCFISNVNATENKTNINENIQSNVNVDLNLDNNEEFKELLEKQNSYKPKYNITVEQYLDTLKMNEENKKYYLNLSKYYTQMVENYNKESVLMTLREPIFMNTTCAILQSGVSSYEFMLVVLNLTLDKIGPDAIEKYKQANEYIEKNEPNVNPSFSKNCAFL